MQTQQDKLKVCNCENNQVNILNNWSNDKRQEVPAVNSFNQKPKLYLRVLSYVTSTSWFNLKPFVNKLSVNQRESTLFIALTSPKKPKSFRSLKSQNDQTLTPCDLKSYFSLCLAIKHISIGY